MLRLLSVETVMVWVGNYPLSYIEFVGTLLYFASVWLIARKQMLTWPVGIVSVVLYAVLFYQIQLYSDAIEQVYYLGVSAYGWIVWERSRGESLRPPGEASERGADASPARPASGAAPAADDHAPARSAIRSSWSAPRAVVVWAAVTLALAVAMSFAVARFHLWLPRLFPVGADYPFLDALTTVMSFVAMFLMARRRTESWVYWIIVDVIGIGLYWVKDVRFISLQYVVLLGMAIYGFVHWLREEREEVRADGLQPDRTLAGPNAIAVTSAPAAATARAVDGELP